MQLYHATFLNTFDTFGISCSFQFPVHLSQHHNYSVDIIDTRQIK